MVGNGVKDCRVPPLQKLDTAAARGTIFVVQFSLVFLTLSLSISANLSDGFLVRLGVDPNILLAALVALVITGLVYHRHLALIVLVTMLTVGANVPVKTAASMGYDPDYLLAALIALVAAPYLRDALAG